MKDKEMKEPLTTEQIKEKYPVGALVRCTRLSDILCRNDRLHGIIIARAQGHSHEYFWVHTSDGENELASNSDWKVIARP